MNKQKGDFVTLLGLYIALVFLVLSILSVEEDWFAAAVLFVLYACVLDWYWKKYFKNKN